MNVRRNGGQPVCPLPLFSPKRNLLFTKKDRVGPLQLILIPAYSFIHGPVAVGGRLGSVIYFKNMQKGVLAVPNKRSEKPEVNYARFSNPLLGRSPVDYNQN